MSKNVIEFYTGYDERSRLTDEFSLERLRTQEVLSRFLGDQPLRILDVGGAAGAYSFWLATLGHRVSLVDLTPKHILQAQERNADSSAKLDHIAVGDATSLEFADHSFDLVLLMGPLYHLQERERRVKALREALRVLKPHGKLVLACISRFASLVDGFQFNLVQDPLFRSILDQDLISGNHNNRTGNPSYFTDAYLHLPEEIVEEARLAGAPSCRLYAVEGVGSILPQIEARLVDPGFRAYLLEKIRQTEEEPSLLGLSSHILGVVSAPTPPASAG